MLLFTVFWTSIFCVSSHFNTSNVTIYQVFPLLRSRLLFISIHLMLLFTRLLLAFCMYAFAISIHLMLLFTGNLFMTITSMYGNFNTSNVTIYLLYFILRISIRCISIHLMLLFTLVVVDYITNFNNFNTSNVTIYQMAS